MRKNKPLAREAYNLTYRLRKKFPMLQKKRSERFFYCNHLISEEVASDSNYLKLQKTYGFTIQQTL